MIIHLRRTDLSHNFTALKKRVGRHDVRFAENLTLSAKLEVIVLQLCDTPADAAIASTEFFTMLNILIIQNV